MTFRSTFLALGLVTSIGLIGCGGPTTDGDTTTTGPDGTCTGKCDGVDEGVPACEGSVRRFDGRELSEEEIKNLDDPFARHVLRAGESCPVGYDAVVDKLREIDNNGCEDERSGMKGMVVSESAQLLDTPTDYRVVVSRACKETDAEGKESKRPDHALTFSLFGVGAVDDVENPGSLPQQVEVMAFDEARGVFNYYEIQASGEIEFFGDSHDILRQNNGIEGDGAGRCASCHVGGGMVMKELDTPWVHWEGHHDTPGAADLVKAHPNLGSKSSGSTMESITKRGNEAFNTSRLELLQAEGTARDVLRPLFCSVEVNLDNGADFARTKDVRVGDDFFFDPNFHRNFSARITIPDEVYVAATKEIGQFMGSRSGAATNAEGEVLTDTIFRFTYVERAHIDNNYVSLLEKQEIVDKELRADILGVDFTRPVFSEARCGLLEHVPDMPGLELTRENLSEGLIESLQAVEEPSAAEAALLDNLTNEERTAEAHAAAATAFIDACKARPEEEFARDALTVASARRNIALETMHFFEFPLTLAQDELSLDGSEHFDAETCEVVTD